MSRYSCPREYIDWGQNSWLECLKMLSWTVKRHEAVGKYELWKRVEELCERVIELVTGDSGISFGRLRDHTFAVQGLKITPDKLYQRADKAERYKEFNLQKEAVVQSYNAIVNKKPAKDPRRNFSDTEVEIAAKRQSHKCLTCEAPLGPLNQPQGAHIVAWSKGGRTTQDNCGAICAGCNNRMSSMDIVTYSRKLGMEAARGRRSLYAT